MGELHAWLEAGVDISVQALIGRAGSGKTRTALELCKAVDNARDAKGDWLAGFLSPDSLNRFVDTLATRSFAWDQHFLLVIDDAGQCHQALGRWLDRLAYQSIAGKLRILLLEREAPTAFGWWHELTGSALHSEQARRNLFWDQTLRPRLLPDLEDVEERRRVMVAALTAARRLRPSAPTVVDVPAKDVDPDFDRRLAEPRFGNPLSLVMAGVVALEQGPTASLALRHLEAARKLGGRELQRLQRLGRSQGLDENATRHIVAFNELAGGLPMAGLRDLIGDELLASRRTTNLDVLLDLLQQEFPSRDTGEQGAGLRLATIQPDLIAEAAIIDAFSGSPTREAEAVQTLGRAYAATGGRAAAVLVRTVQDFGYAAEDSTATPDEQMTGRRVLGWLLELARRIEDVEQLEPLVFALPLPTIILREAAAELTGKLAAAWHQVAEASNDFAAGAKAALWLNNLANRLSELGRREEALDAAEAAAGLHSVLAQVRPDAFTPDLARSLNTLAAMLGELGRREEALDAAEDAHSLFRTLAQARPDAFAPNLAGALNNLANRLNDLGRREEALDAAEDAVSLYRTLAQVRPDAFTPDLAISLNTLANRLSELGRREEALDAAEAAAGLHSVLAQVRPDAFTPYLATSLGALGRVHVGEGAVERGVQAFAEGIAVLTPKFAANPMPFERLMNALLTDYLTQIEVLSQKPKEELIQPVMAVLAKIKHSEFDDAD